MNIVWTASLLFTLAPVRPLLGAQVVGHGAGHDTKPTSALIEKVRAASAPFRDVRNTSGLYEPILGCVSGPLEGQLLQFEDSPNRFGLPAFYQLHVWAWRDNPNGAFVDWNPRVSCEGQ
jgi:hypothetical protein